MFRVIAVNSGMRYIFLCLLLGGIKTAAQVTPAEILDQLAANLIQQYSKDAKELIALHTDKTIYRAGSNIWFRAYSVSSNGYPVSVKNKIIFVELVNKNDSVMDRVLLNEDSMQFHGSARVPDDAKEGYYQLRAYTKTIIQQYPADIFTCPVYIINDKNNNAESKPVQNDGEEPLIKFYPEGNNLINGVSCTVVYTATDKFGNPIKVSGVVKDNNGTEVINFSGTGIGKFSFEPYLKDRTYKVYIKRNNAPELTYPLQEIRTDAFQLSLQQRTADQLVFRVALGDSVYNKKAQSFLLGISSGKVFFASAGSGMYMVKVPVSNMPHGIADFYLFDEKKEMVSKRSVFNENNSPKINITTDRQDYITRQKVNVNLTITDNENKPVRAALSVSVTDNKLTAGPSSLHTADLFLMLRNNTGLTMADLFSNSDNRDLVAVTLGNEGHFPGKDPEIKLDRNFYWDGLEVKGSVKDKQNIGLANELVTLVPDQVNTTLYDSTDNKGIFSFRDLTFYGTQRFYVMVPAIYNKQQKYEIIMEKNPYPVIHTASSFQYTIGSSLLQSLAEFKKQHADSCITGNSRLNLQQMAVEDAGGKKKTNVPKKGLSSHRITAETLDKLSLSNTVDAVKMLPGVIMMNNRLTIRGGLQSLNGNLSDIEPLLVVDGVPTNAVSVVDYLNSIPPSNIDYIDVLTGPDAALYGTRGGNGVIVVKTSNQIRETKNNDGKEKQTIIASGFYKTQPFFAPPYEVDVVRDAAFTDNRATVYWNGQLITDAAGKTNFSFYTTDLKNDYIITVQGITDKGELIYKTYTVKRR